MKTKIIEMKMINYFEQEYENAIQGIDRNYNKPTEVVFNAEQRMLGVANFCQSLGIDYAFIEKYYNTYKEMLEKLLTN
jgi:hypothetical protein